MIGNALNFKKMSNTIKEEDEKSSSSSSSSNTKSNINVKLAQNGKRSSISQSKKSPEKESLLKMDFKSFYIVIF